MKIGSIIYSDSWKAYEGIHVLGYEHEMVNHSKNILKPGNPQVHTKNIERLWRDVKEWIRRSGMRSLYLTQYLSRYLFIMSFQSEDLLHDFFLQAAKLYPPGQHHQLQEPQHSSFSGERVNTSRTTYKAMDVASTAMSE